MRLESEEQHSQMVLQLIKNQEKLVSFNLYSINHLFILGTTTET